MDEASIAVLKRNLIDVEALIARIRESGKIPRARLRDARWLSVKGFLDLLVSQRWSRARRPSTCRTADQRAADRIDGYDRDDLGESPDF